MKRSLWIVIALLVIGLSGAHFANSVQAAGEMPVVFTQLGVTQGGQALKALALVNSPFASPSAQPVPLVAWTGQNFLFKTANPNDGSSCETQAPVSNGAGEVFGSCVSANNQPFDVYLEHTSDKRRSAYFKVKPLPISAPISGPQFSPVPISGPISQPSPIGFTFEFVTPFVPNARFSHMYRTTIQTISSDTAHPIQVRLSPLPKGINVSCEEGLEFLRARRLSTCYISGIPTISGNVSFRATARVAGTTITKDYFFQISNDPMTLKIEKLTSGQVGRSYQALVTASDPDLSDSLKVTISGLPTGLSSYCNVGFNIFHTQLVNSCGIYGTPQVAGIYIVTIAAKDQGGNTATNQVVVNIAPKAAQMQLPVIIKSAKVPAPRIITTTLRTGRTAMPYRGIIQGESYVRDYRKPNLSLQGLPTGLHSTCKTGFDFFFFKQIATCEVTGEVTAAGIHTIIATINDNEGQSQQAELNLEIINQPVAFATTTLPKGKVNQNYRAQIKIVDPDVHDNLNLSIANLPAGLQFQCVQKNNFFSTTRNVTCNIQGKPKNAGITQVKAIGNDNAGHQIEQFFNLEVKP